MFEEPVLKDLEKKVIFRLLSMYRKEVTKKVQDFLRDSTPFQMAASITLRLYFSCSFMSFFFFFLLTATGSNEHFLCLHGEVLRCSTTPA